jgi:alkylhydroperoxidase family enzyme
MELHRGGQEVADLLRDVQAEMGMIPNLLLFMAHSPAVLKGFLTLRDGLEWGVLTDKLRGHISLAVAERHRSEYNLAAYSALGRTAGMSDEEIIDARCGRSPNSKLQAALRFACAVVDRGGDVKDEDLARLRAAGYGNREIVEILAWVGVSTFSDYFAQVTQAEIDFPKVSEITHG